MEEAEGGKEELIAEEEEEEEEEDEEDIDGDKEDEEKPKRKRRSRQLATNAYKSSRVSEQPNTPSMHSRFGNLTRTVVVAKSPLNLLEREVTSFFPLACARIEREVRKKSCCVTSKKPSAGLG